MKGLFKLLGAIFTFQLGAVVAMLFAQKTGKTLRKDMKKADNPLKVLFDEGLKIDKEILSNVQDWAQNSEGVQELIGQLEEVKGQAKDMTEEAKAEMQKNLEKVAKEAKSAAEDLKKTAKKKTTTAKKRVATKAKTVKKKATTARKTASKAVKKSVKKS